MGEVGPLGPNNAKRLIVRCTNGSERTVYRAPKPGLGRMVGVGPP
jgi:hypothetical protein